MNTAPARLETFGKRVSTPSLVFLLLSLLFLGACGDLEETPATLETTGLGEALEAENAQIRTNFVRQSSADASAGRYLTQATWADNTRNPKEEAVLSFTVPSKKRYTLWARLYGVSNDQDAVYLGFDGELLRRYPEAHGRYEWVEVSTKELTSGSHRVSIGHAEAGARIDMMVVSGESLSNDMLDSFVNARAGAPSSAPSQAHRYDILKELNGFGEDTTGGKGGSVVEVTNLNDSGSGSLRDAMGKSGRKWIVFRRGLSGQINLKKPLKVDSNTTVDGRGANITITGYPLEVDGRTEKRVGNNVIIMYLKFKDSVDDAICIRDGAKDVWVHRNSFEWTRDGQVDIITGATDITLSWNHFSDHLKSVLIGSGRDSGGERVTLHHNYFSGIDERTPRTRSRVHFYNNYVRGWRWDPVYASDGGHIYSEANVYTPSGRKRVSAYASSNRGYVKSVNDRLEDGAYFQTTGSDRVFRPSSYYSYRAETAGSSLKSKVADGAGWRSVSRP